MSYRGNDHDADPGDDERDALRRQREHMRKQAREGSVPTGLPWGYAPIPKDDKKEKPQ